MTNSKATKKLTAIAKAEVGYLEKKNGKDLESKTANPGSGNFVVYWKRVYPAFQGQPWCACFVSFCFMEAFGKSYAAKLLKHWPFTYCPTLAGMTTNKTPKPGSVVLFYRNGEYAHTGIVIEVTKTTITTIEGNTSNGSTIIPNGGAVCEKTYAISSLSGMTKYFLPDYKIVKDESEEKSNQGNETKPAEKPSQGNSTSSEMNQVPLWYGTVTASSLNVRIWAGTEYPQIKSVPSIPRGAIVGVCAMISAMNAEPWYYVEIVGKGIYGFVCARYVMRN